MRRRVNIKIDGLSRTAMLNVRSLAYRMRRKAATVAMMALTLPIGYKAFFGNNGAIAYHEKKVESNKLDVQIKDLQSQNAKIKDENVALRTDKNAIEREAREQLHYARPDEIVITMPQQPSPAQAQQEHLSARK